MILLLDRHRPIEFDFPSRCIRSLFKQPRHNRRVHKLQGGPGSVIRTLIRQMNLAQPPLHWAICLRDFPKTDCEVAWVVNDPDDLKWAIQNRKRLRARKLWAGPNIVVVPQEADAVLTKPEIDCIVVPTKWVADVYSRERSELAPKIWIWPAAIDTDFWTPASPPKLYWVIYNKYEDALAAQIAKVLERLNVRFVQITYGQYPHMKYREILENAIGLIWLSRSESQGLALLEALSMDVPAAVWDPGDWKYQSPELKREFTASATSAPYFSDECGVRFKSALEFESVFQTFSEHSASYHPREYILKNGLDLRSNKDRIMSLIRSSL